jgi:hypothetical protein
MAMIIPESIVGLDFFAPDMYDDFTILTGDMPDGSDALRFDLITARAFVAAPVLSPNVFLDRLPGAFSIVIWVKGGTSSTTSGAQHNQTIFSVENINWTGSAASNDYMWSIFYSRPTSNPSTNTQLRLHWKRTSSASYVITANIGVNTWRMCYFGISADGTTAYQWIDGDLAVTESSMGAPGVWTPNPGMYLSLGKYGDRTQGPSGTNSTSGMTQGTAGREPIIGKFSIHPHLLTVTDLNMLYNAMMNP